MLASRPALSASRCALLSGLFSRVLVLPSAVSSQTVSSFCSSSSSSTSSPSSQKTFLASIIGSSLSSRFLCSFRGSSSEEDEGEMSISRGTPSVVPSKGEHKGTIIFLHGLGDQGHGWADAFRSEVKLDNIKTICPHSADRSVTLNMGMSMPAWYDLFGLDANSREDDGGIQLASQYVHQLIDSEVAAGIPASRIAVGGFSMGGALAIYAGLTYPQKLGGIVGLSSFFLQRNKFPGNWTANNGTPIFLGHGNMDPLVPLPIGQMSEQFIKKFNPNVQFHVYSGMGHSSCPQEMQEVKTFLTNSITK
uniref:palmitoyl-protein hydrolase n=1 Tax=Caenorhabditis japonica TaxID=281687 RepID=A0A8R1I017_CAEJA